MNNLTISQINTLRELKIKANNKLSGFSIDNLQYQQNETSFFDNPLINVASKKYIIGFQEPVTPVAEAIIRFHNDLFTFLVFISIFVFVLLIIGFINFSQLNILPNKKTYFEHNTLLEIIWTLIPAFSLIFVASLSLPLLYSIEHMVDPLFTLRILGNQWYWEYSMRKNSLNNAYYSFKTFPKDKAKFMLTKNITILDKIIGKKDSDTPKIIKIRSDINKSNSITRWTSISSFPIEFNNSFRNLLTDNIPYLPSRTRIRFLLTSNDVIHSWAVPSLGIKLDAIPGRLNQIWTFIKRPGVYLGICSEICGAGHSFIPISIKVI